MVPKVMVNGVHLDIGFSSPLVVDVRTFGTVGDGVADDTAAIQAAINSLSSGDALFFPPPPVEYKTSSVLRDNGQDRISVLGVGQGSKIVGTSQHQSIFTISGRSGWEFHGLWLYGPGTGRQVQVDQEGCGIQFITCSYCSVSDCRFENHGLHDGVDVGLGGVYWRESCTYCRVENCLFIDCNSAVLEDAYIQTATPYGNVINGNVSRRCRAHYASDGRAQPGGGPIIDSGIVITNNSIDGHAADSSNERYGIRLMETRGAVVSGNHIRNVKTGIEIHSECRSCSVTGNTVYNATGSGGYGGYGIHVLSNPSTSSRKPAYCVLSSNMIQLTSSHGIYLQDGSEVLVNGNLVQAAGGEGIRCALSRANISGNQVEAAGSHGIYVTGATCDTVNIVGNLLRGDGADTGLIDDGIRVDATVGGRTHIEGNLIMNQAATAGFKYGVNQPSGGAVVTHGFNRIYSMGVAKYNPAGMVTDALSNPVLDRPVALTTQTIVTSAASGAASALPTTPEGYIIFGINGTNRKIPFYV